MAVMWLKFYVGTRQKVVKCLVWLKKTVLFFCRKKFAASFKANFRVTFLLEASRNQNSISVHASAILFSRIELVGGQLIRHKISF